MIVAKHAKRDKKTYIHRQPLYPPTPLIFEMAYARSPENAPAIEAAEKNKACRS